MDKTLFMIGNAHIDPVWLWRWDDGFSEIRATFRSALERMKEYPEFVFTSGAAAFYEWIEKNDPAMFEEIRLRVKEGRWQVVGGWWVQADCNAPSGESFARQALIAQRYFMEKFGVMATTGYNVDSFGHSGSIPKILRMSGMENYVFMRPGAHEKSYPSWVFQWQSPEGDAVTAARIPFEYCTWGRELGAHVRRCAAEIRDGNGLMCFYGVGNHGGGPTRENLDSIRELDGRDGVSLRMSGPDGYFRQLDRSGLPVVNGDLLHHASGCYAAHSGVKRWNRQAENRLLTAEKWSLAALALLGKAYPGEEYRRAWKKVLFNQFHDILAGSSIREAYEDTREDYGYALSVGAEHLNDALQALMGNMDIPLLEGARHYAVFNPQGFEALCPVALEAASLKGPMVLRDSAGEEVPFQLGAASAAANGRAGLRFLARVPAMGWEVYTLAPDARAQAPEAEPDLSLTLENSLVSATFDAAAGGLASLVLKDSGVQILRAPAYASIITDSSDTWSHTVLCFNQEEGRMALRDIRVTASGPVFKTIRAEYAYGQSTLVQEYTLYVGLPQIFVRCRLDWREKQKVLKLCLPVSHHHCHVTAQAPFGFADRLLDGQEYPMQGWVDVTGIAPGEHQELSGLAVLNDGKTSYSAKARTLEITAARSPYYANHDPFVVREGMDYPLIDQGTQEFTLALLAHKGDTARGGVDGQAMLLGAPFLALPESAHPGMLGQRGGFLSLRAAHTVLDALKLAEDGTEELVVHLHETARRAETVELSLSTLGRTVSLDMRPGEIRALRISLKDGTAREVDLLEMDRQSRLKGDEQG